MVPAVCPGKHGQVREESLHEAHLRLLCWDVKCHILAPELVATVEHLPAWGICQITQRLAENLSGGCAVTVLMAYVAPCKADVQPLRLRLILGFWLTWLRAQTSRNHCDVLDQSPA